MRNNQAALFLFFLRKILKSVILSIATLAEKVNIKNRLGNGEFNFIKV